MAKEEKTRQPRRSAAGEAAAERRRQRLAAALRANLGRRKAQARERAEASPPTPTKGKRD
jgi:hypothetical protein